MRETAEGPQPDLIDAHIAARWFDEHPNRPKIGDLADEFALHRNSIRARIQALQRHHLVLPAIFTLDETRLGERVERIYFDDAGADAPARALLLPHVKHVTGYASGFSALIAAPSERALAQEVELLSALVAAKPSTRLRQERKGVGTRISGRQRRILARLVGVRVDEWPRHTATADISVRTFSRHIAALEQAGILRTMPSGDRPAGVVLESARAPPIPPFWRERGQAENRYWFLSPPALDVPSSLRVEAWAVSDVYHHSLRERLAKE